MFADPTKQNIYFHFDWAPKQDLITGTQFLGNTYALWFLGFPISQEQKENFTENLSTQLYRGIL